jgi:polysaccharide chain length determinant protein (PEP-CTERM system associated)
VLIDRQQLPEEFVRPTVTGAIEVRLHTLSQEILSRPRLSALIDRFGLYPSLREAVPAEALADRLRDDIRIELVGADDLGSRADAPGGRVVVARPGSTVAFSISYRGSSPETVAQVTNTLASFYIEENLKVRGRQATGTAQFLKVQLEETKRRLDEQEKKVSEFKKRHLTELPGQLNTNLATLQQLKDQLRLNGLNQTRASEKRELLELQLQTLSTTAETFVLGPSGEPLLVQDPRIRLARLKEELGQLRATFTDKYPDVRRVQEEIASLEREIAATPAPAPGGPGLPTGVSPSSNPAVMRVRQAFGEADAELKALKNDEKALRQSIAVYEERIANVPRREQELQEVSRDYETTRTLHDTLTKRYEEAQLAETMEQRHKSEQFRVLDPAVPALQPAAPRRTRLLAMGFVLSVGLAVGAVILREHLDTSFHTLDDLRAFTTAPVLASIPRLTTAADRRRWRGRFVLGSLVALVSLVLLAAATAWLALDNEQLVWIVTRGKG